MTEHSACLHILKPGPLCTLQDLGRPRYMHMGVSPAGSADQYAALWANRLLGNPANASLLEISFGGFRAEFERETQIAICGAETEVWVNDQPFSAWRSINISAGSEVRIAMPKSGVYSYLAVLGGFTEREELGSQSMTVREALGPNRATPFSAGDTLTYLTQHQKLSERFAFWNSIPDYTETLTLNIYMCQQGLFISDSQRQVLLSTEYKVHPDSNKMGVRFDGTALELNTSVKASEGVIAGTVQLPPSGQPIALLAEHQTIGGYPKLGTISRVDTYRLAQHRPGQAVKFQSVELVEMQKSFANFRRFFLA